MRRGGAALTAVVALALVLGGCTAVPSASEPATTTPAATETTDLEQALSELPKVSKTPLPTMRLTKGLLPPTNRWFSGLVFGAQPQPVFPLPLAVSPTASGFTTTLPTVTATANTIFGPAGGGLGLELGATGFTVTRYDDLTVTMTYTDAQGPVADVLIAEGWPYVAMTARRSLDATASAPLEPGGVDSWRATAGGTPYGLRAPDATVSGTKVHLPAGATAVVFGLPASADAQALLRGAAGVVQGGSATGGSGGDRISTTLTYTTASGAATVLAARPGTKPSGAQCIAGQVRTIYGDAPLCVGTTTTTTVPRITPSATLDLSKLAAAQRTMILQQLRKDLAATPAEPPDTYAGGKWLYRVANLLQLARGLDAVPEVKTARSLLDASLTGWTDPDGCTKRATHCFVYDPVLHGVVGHEASYGSDEFNDHHFHYGYFLYAAAVAVEDQPSLRARIAPVIDLLAADIASPASTDDLPADRVFDPYAGHSWASGYAPFADGNNQESTSEAVNAWNGLALWANVTDDAALRNHAAWLLSSEAASAKRDWLEPDLDGFAGFTHSFVSLNWGGKRDSATWFSADPAAKLGIQLIPMSPVFTYLAGNPARIRANLTEARSAGTGLFADYLLMYESIGAGSGSQLTRAAAGMPASQIDTANSTSYLSAWLAAH